MIQAYFDGLKQVIDRYATAPFVLDAQVNFELRPGDQGYVVGAVLFQDESSLNGAAETISESRSKLLAGWRDYQAICVCQRNS